MCLFGCSLRLCIGFLLSLQGLGRCCFLLRLLFGGFLLLLLKKGSLLVSFTLLLFFGSLVGQLLLLCDLLGFSLGFRNFYCLDLIKPSFLSLGGLGLLSGGGIGLSFLGIELGLGDLSISLALCLFLKLDL